MRGAQGAEQARPDAELQPLHWCCTVLQPRLAAMRPN
jgi:hypothetical protein